MTLNGTAVDLATSNNSFFNPANQAFYKSDMPPAGFATGVPIPVTVSLGGWTATASATLPTASAVTITSPLTGDPYVPGDVVNVAWAYTPPAQTPAGVEFFAFGATQGSYQTTTMDGSITGLSLPSYVTEDFSGDLAIQVSMVNSLSWSFSGSLPVLTAGSIQHVDGSDAIVLNEACPDEDGDGWGSPATDPCAPNIWEDCDDDPSDDPVICATCACGDAGCSVCAHCINPGVLERPSGSEVCTDGVDNDCDGLADDQDLGCD